MSAGPNPPEVAIDEQGVDRTLVREMLALTPAERLLRLQDLVEGVLEIRERNARRTLP